MTPKHTPGPWKYDETYGLITAERDEVEIAACHAGRGSDAKANARLIAAAPDLLAALKHCLEDDAGDLRPETVHLAMESISKAERGKQ